MMYTNKYFMKNTIRWLHISIVETYICGNMLNLLCIKNFLELYFGDNRYFSKLFIKYQINHVSKFFKNEIQYSDVIFLYSAEPSEKYHINKN